MAEKEYVPPPPEPEDLAMEEEEMKDAVPVAEALRDSGSLEAGTGDTNRTAGYYKDKGVDSGYMDAKPHDMSEAAQILSASRDNVGGNPTPEEVHEAAKMMGSAGGSA